MRPGAASVKVVLAALLLLGVAACGKKSSPRAPGPPDQITFPKTYPTR